MELLSKQPSHTRLRESARPPQTHAARICRAFSLLELLIVIAVTLTLTALLMPALRHVHENANRVICMAHLQQIGQGITMYALNHNDRLPFSNVLHQDAPPTELMLARKPGNTGPGWDGLGLLYFASYCPAPQCFYCPSHKGNHPYDRYADVWEFGPPTQPIFTNYHYAGDVEWTDKTSRRWLSDGHQMVLATDGLRTANDFNHFDGMNVLRGDGSVRWRDDTQNIREQLPKTETEPPMPAYTGLWDTLEQLAP